MEVFMRTLALGIGLSSIVGVAFFASACSNSVVVGKGGAGGMSGTTTAATNTVGNGTTGTNGTGGMTSATNGTGTVGTTTGSANTGSTGTGISCTPGPGDNMCSSCVKTKCCADIMSCDADASCATCAACIEANGNNPAACQGMCNFQNMPTQKLVGCAYQSCQMECGGGMTTTTTGTGMTTSTSTGGMTCPPMAGDTMCVACAKQHCCSQYDACAADMKCVCWATCVGGGGSVQMCFQQCGQPDNTTFALQQCTNNNNCGCGGMMGG
jgi:hypothetical protein